MINEEVNHMHSENDLHLSKYTSTQHSRRRSSLSNLSNLGSLESRNRSNSSTNRNFTNRNDALNEVRDANTDGNQRSIMSRGVFSKADQAQKTQTQNFANKSQSNLMKRCESEKNALSVNSSTVRDSSQLITRFVNQIAPTLDDLLERGSFTDLSTLLAFLQRAKRLVHNTIQRRFQFAQPRVMSFSESLDHPSNMSQNAEGVNTYASTGRNLFIHALHHGIEFNTETLQKIVPTRTYLENADDKRRASRERKGIDEEGNKWLHEFLQSC